MAAPATWRETVAEGRGGLTLGIVLVQFVTAIQALVVTAVMPAVSRDLGGLQFYGLIFSAFALAALAATPTAGRRADQRGFVGPFALMTLLFALGALLSGLAPSMPFLVAMRIVEGYGAGGASTIAFAAVAKAYPEATRARVLALQSAAWVIPGLLGPSFGALLASTVGWRWAFFSLIPPAILAAALVLPSLSRLGGGAHSAQRLSLRWPIQLAFGLGAVLIGLSLVSWVILPAVLLGVVLTWPALVAILPAGSLQARSGLPAAVAGLFLLLIGFVSADYFLPLLLTAVRGRSLAEAGIILTLATLSWALGSWWQSRSAGLRSTANLVRGGSSLVAFGALGVAGALVGLPLWLPYLAWTIAGFGMGIAYPALTMVVMGSASAGEEATAVSSGLLAEQLGLALAGGMAGISVALASAVGAPLTVGLSGAFLLALAGSLATLAIAGRLPQTQPRRAEPVRPPSIA